MLILHCFPPRRNTSAHRQVRLTMNGMLKSKHLDLVEWVLLVSGIWDTCNQLSLGKTAM
jgi:hypothetical protein